MATEVIVRKWGSSLGIVLPKELVKQKHIKERQKVFIDIGKAADLTLIFGKFKRKLSGQQFKDLVRRGWEQ